MKADTSKKKAQKETASKREKMPAELRKKYMEARRTTAEGEHVETAAVVSEHIEK